MGRHVMEALGLSRITVEDGEIIEVTEPMMSFCPMFARMHGMEHLDSESIRKNIEYRINDFGIFTENRQVRGNDIVTFGVSEILSRAIRQGKLDAACIVSDGCGSAIVTDPEVLQGLCGRISGIIETSPLNVVLDAVGRENVLDPETTPIDQLAIAAKAAERDYKRFAVTVADPAQGKVLRELYGDRVVIIGVHTSGHCAGSTKLYFEYCDFITACASNRIRQIAYKLHEEGKVEIAGNKVQIVAVSDIGKDFVRDKLESLGKQFWDGELETVDPEFIDY